ncbi:GGDEF domain-containing phosphodiesterase [Labrenzia sp. 011]|uniref:putative bifunctional diguanylate cyclase/phosphodiesterase n=1 Tax=Labrenzia sp. 011 TaxID=2171494 RepID=UPI0014020B68|nr:GGDEF domain-containing phosphodiesterase [Labrenzia sp. 011]
MLCCLVLVLLAVNGRYVHQADIRVREASLFETALLAQIVHFSTSDLEKYVARSGVLKTEADRLAAEQAFQNLSETLKTWRQGDIRALSGISGQTGSQLDSIQQDSRELAPLLNDLHNTASVTRALVLLQDMERILDQIKEAVAGEAAEQTATAKQDLIFHQKIHTALIFALILAGLGWVFTLKKRNSALKKARGATLEQLARLTGRLDCDRVTGLGNYRVFTDRVTQASNALTAGQTLSVFCVDLETALLTSGNFDLRGENAVLASTAEMLRNSIELLEGTTCLARSRGKGFLIMTVTDDAPGLSAQEIAHRILALFLRPLSTGKGTFLITPAIGYAETRTSEQDPAELICNGELAAADAVANGSRHAVTFQPAMRTEVARRATVENALAQAIETNECLPYFQPQFNLKTGRIHGVEALARWYHSDLGWISPSEFIPIAEKTGDIVSLGWKILETSCAEVQLLPNALTLSVNLSVAQFHNDDIVAMLEDCLQRTGLPATRLKLEITGTGDLQHIQDVLTELRALGVRISLDNFGFGNSPLCCLTDFQWDEIKIDRSFSGRAVSDPKSRHILKLVLDVAETLGSEVLVEGIETVEQRDVLVDLGCVNGQGYLFGGPMAIDDVTTLFFPQHSQHCRAETSA